MQARFVEDAAGTVLALPTAEPDESFLSFRAALVARLRGGAGLHLQYDVDLERSDLELETLRLGVSFAF